MTGGVKNPNAPVMVQKTAGGRVGGGNASAQVQRVAKGRSGGGNKSAERSSGRPRGARPCGDSGCRKPLCCQASTRHCRRRWDIARGRCGRADARRYRCGRNAACPPHCRARRGRRQSVSHRATARTNPSRPAPSAQARLGRARLSRMPGQLPK